MEKKLLVKYTDVQICREELTILKHINFELYSGEFVYFIGRVGSGKSSLLKTMYADLPIYEGEAIVLDFDVRHLKNKEIPPAAVNVNLLSADSADYQALPGDINAAKAAALNSEFIKDALPERIMQVYCK